MIKNNLPKIRKEFKINKIDGYIIPKNDEFFAEYVNSSNERLKYLTGFSGSMGQALILKNKAFLFVDGRYTLQAKKEIGKGFEIVEIHKIKPSQILQKNKKTIAIGYDPKLYTEFILKNLFKVNKVKLVPIRKNLIDKIWLNRPKTKFKKFFILSTKFVGQSYKQKINLVCNILKKNNLKNLLITAPENIAWMLNIRGKDNYFSPVPNCNAIVNYKKKVTLIVDNDKISKKFRSKFGKILKYVSPPNVVGYLNSLDTRENFLIDKITCSYFYKNQIAKKFKYIEKIDPIFFLKSKKNNIEINNTIKSHIEDGVALTKFIF